MAANPRHVTAAQPGAGTVTLTEHDGTTATAQVSELIRQELIPAATLAFPGIPGNRWLRQSNDAIRRALVDVTLPPGIEQAPPPVSNGRAKKVRNAPAPTPIPPVTGLSDLLTEVVRPIVVEEVRRALAGVRLVTTDTLEDK